MELKYTTKNGRLTVTLEGKTQAELFEQLAQFQEVFEVDCVANGKTSSDLKFLVREDKEENKYYEVMCQDMDKDLKGRRLSYGQHKKGGSLFPRRTTEVEENGQKKSVYLKNGGWGRYDFEKKEMSYD